MKKLTNNSPLWFGEKKDDVVISDLIFAHWFRKVSNYINEQNFDAYYQNFVTQKFIFVTYKTWLYVYERGQLSFNCNYDELVESERVVELKSEVVSIECRKEFAYTVAKFLQNYYN